jgi:hypothetical protein
VWRTKNYAINRWHGNRMKADQKRNFKEFLTVCKDFGLYVILDKLKVMKIKQKVGGMEKV